MHGGCVPNADGSSLGHHAIRTETGLATRIMRLSTSPPSALHQHPSGGGSDADVLEVIKWPELGGYLKQGTFVWASWR